MRAPDVPTNQTGMPFDEGRTTKLAVRSEVSRPPLTVSLGLAMYTFAADRDVVVGRGRECDICLHDDGRADLSLISRMHAVLRFDGAKWLVVDKSQNGVFVDGARNPLTVIHDGRSVTLGSRHGPQLTFRVASSSVPVRPKPRIGDTMRMLLPSRPSIPPVESTTIGRAETNDVVVDDALASRVHAVLVSTPDGLEIRDNDSSNGTFVNRAAVTQALLRDGDVVTVGNTDLVVSGHTLVPRTAPVHTSGLAADRLALTIDSHQLLKDVSFSAKPGTLTAVIGPSGAGKSTLAKVIGGATLPSAGVVTFDGHGVHANYALMRSRIGMVPQEDVVHRQLTVEQALGYAAELRLPPDTSADDRRQVVTRVLDELDLTPHRKTRVDKLSGGQRKRASVAMELLTGPSLLILDEPTSGLDPGLDRQVMKMLRRIADAGRVVIVVTHSLTYVEICDQIVLLAPGGMTAFADPPAEIGPAMGTTDWADPVRDEDYAAAG